MELIGRGRACDVYAVGPGRVLRRDRAGTSTETEALTMRHAALHGYPAPAVYDASGPDIVMERLDGPTMLDRMSSRPWELARHAQVLADLVDRLGRVPLPDHELPLVDPPGDVLVHLDLHPANVITTAAGPVVIDWSNAAAGTAGLDAANTWITVAAGAPPGSIVTRLVAAAGRRIFLRQFLASIDRPQASAHLGAALAWRERDPNLSTDEIDTMRAVVAAAT